MFLILRQTGEPCWCLARLVDQWTRNGAMMNLWRLGG
jgi:hypothetical protein